MAGTRDPPQSFGEMPVRPELSTPNYSHLQPLRVETLTPPKTTPEPRKKCTCYGDGRCACEVASEKATDTEYMRFDPNVESKGSFSVSHEKPPADSTSLRITRSDAPELTEKGNQMVDKIRKGIIKMKRTAEEWMNHSLRLAETAAVAVGYVAS